MRVIQPSRGLLCFVCAKPAHMVALASCVFVLLPLLMSPAIAQTVTSRSLITQPVDDSKLTRLIGNTYPLARVQFDRGPASSDLLLNRMVLVLKRSPAEETALESFMEGQQDNSSPNYHNWLTAAQFGTQFGPSDQDIQTITAWLNSHGLQVTKVSSGRVYLEFSGTVAQVSAAFHTEIHNYNVNGQAHLANASDPLIPTALTPAVTGVLSLHDFRKQSNYHVTGVFGRSPETGQIKSASPAFTEQCGINSSQQPVYCYPLGPYDFATIYNVSPLWNAASPINGSGVSIAIVARTNINVQDAAQFRNLFGLPANPPQIILDGPDPGIVSGDETEADLDVEWSGAVATAATIDLVVSQSTETSDGVDLSAAYIVDNDLAPVMSESYGECELGLGSAGNAFENNLWQQAAAEGITVFVSSGDSGAANCDSDDAVAPAPAQFGLQVNGLSSTPYNVSVGGTDFDEAFTASQYWNTTSNATTLQSAKSYIPETAWNSTCTNAIFGNPNLGFSANPETNCNNSQLSGYVVTIGGGGGASGCISPAGSSPSSCTGGYLKPAWQAGSGVPNDGVRDVPDVALFASNGFEGSFYMMCEADISNGSCSPTNFVGVGGTSASTPAFAGLLALVNQHTGARQGNANTVFYKLAANQPAASCNSSSGPGATCVFNDITSGTIAMPCARGSSNCTVSSQGDQYGVLSGYQTEVGYDQATGLGSVNANNLVLNWTGTGSASSSTALSLNGGQAVNITHGTPVPFSISVSPNSPEPTGNVTLFAAQSGASAGFAAFALNNGSASGTTNLLPGGASYNVRANYSGDSNYAPSTSSPITVTVNPEPSQTDLHVVTFNVSNGQVASSNASSIPYGTPYFLRADITNNSAQFCFNGTTGSFSYACPTGTVSLTDNSNPISGGSLGLNSQGYTELQGIELTGGTHLLKGNYSGDNSYLSSLGSDSITITPEATATSLNEGLKFAQIGSPITVSVLATALNAGVYSTAPTGSFSIMDGSTVVGTAPALGSGSVFVYDSPYTYADLLGNVTFTPAGPPGARSLTFSYSGDANYAGSVSPVATVNEVYSTTTSVSATPSSSSFGQNVVLSATITPSQSGGVAPNGTVTFTSSQDNALGTAAVVNGQAQLTTNDLFPPTTGIVATYSGDSNYGPSTGQTAVAISQQSTTTNASSSSPSAAIGANVTLTAQVVPTVTGAVAPTGTVKFTGNGGSNLGTVAISNGQAQQTLTFNQAGQQTIQASYSGDFNYLPSVGTFTQNIVATPDFSMSANPAALIVTIPGQSASTTITFNSYNGFTGSATLSSALVSGLPADTSCSFSPSVVTFTSGVTTVPVTMTVNTLAATADFLAPLRLRRQFPSNLLRIKLVLAISGAFVVLYFCARWRIRRLVLISAAFAAIAAASSCGGTTGGGGGGAAPPANPGTSAGNYPLVITVTINGDTHVITNVLLEVQ
jgi:Pro-kumamolisin, activation domain/Bacterial Ig-like domain (group 3)